MCGLCGILTPDGAAAQPEFGAAVERMTALMERRGPDDAGAWLSPDGRVRLGFRRLAVIDLTEAARQPMVRERGAIALNGEIYNHLELRSELEAEGVRFRSRSDTEVLLEALQRWGEAAIERLNGMFAFAWYDTRARRLVLARDHAGIKPLYYFVHPAGRGVAFASQYNALLHTPWGEPGPLRPDVLRLYLRLHHMPPPYALLANTHQVEPGGVVVVREDGTLASRRWWRLPERPEPSVRGQRALEMLDAAIDGAVRRQRIADVPLGVFLSGGVDSPLVTAVARAQTGPDLKAFTIGNPGWWQDESEDASRYARTLDVDHRLRPVSGEEALAAVPDVAAAQHEPFADFSVLPTLLISRLARDEVTVALSGDGGDELFFGYERPLSLLRGGADFRWPRLIRMALYGAGKYGLGPKRSGSILARDPGDYYLGVNCRMRDDDLRAIAPDLPSLPSDLDIYRYGRYAGPKSLADLSRRAEFYGQLQRGLKKVDMASGHHSLEVRVPLLDREVLDVSLRMDPFECMRNGTRKAPLRDLLGGRVPADIIPTSKRGFAVPLGDWLRGPLRPMIEDTLCGAPDLYPQGIFRREAVRRYVDDHTSGRADHKWGIWTLLALQWWAAQHAAAPVR
ncbi:MAG TPA: asparagine synthase (glutamine-hydrolyzing) [Chthonomonadales bacterium]|nr:asparagine synthase (glutamine-hydrolyzing) [Chthonomonadales bacterium]